MTVSLVASLFLFELKQHLGKKKHESMLVNCRKIIKFRASIENNRLNIILNDKFLIAISESSQNLIQLLSANQINRGLIICQYLRTLLGLRYSVNVYVWVGMLFTPTHVYFFVCKPRVVKFGAQLNMCKIYYKSNIEFDMTYCDVSIMTSC